jgi:hypothetical protein
VDPDNSQGTSDTSTAVSSSSLHVLEEALLSLVRRYNRAHSTAPASPLPHERSEVVHSSASATPLQALGYVDTRFLHHPTEAVPVAADLGAGRKDRNLALVGRVSAETVCLSTVTVLSVPASDSALYAPQTGGAVSSGHPAAGAGRGSDGGAPSGTVGATKTGARHRDGGWASSCDGERWA